MTYKVDNTFPAKLGDIVSLNGLTFDTEAATFMPRVKRLFIKAFGIQPDALDDDYWKILMDMISKPDLTFGLVGIDGYYTDIMGKDDLALVFNMGIPKLRGRRVNYLDRVYVRIAHGSNIKFYNSLLDKDENDVHFTFEDKIAAWHPHISSADPCLGSYSTELARWKAEGNPIMYLRTVLQFLNTWNVRSPFWNINEITLNWNTPGGKHFKTSKLINACSKIGTNITRSLERYVMFNVDKIDTGSVANDIYCLVNIFHKENQIKAHISDRLLHYVDRGQYGYLRQHHTACVNSDERTIVNQNSIIVRNSRVLIPKSENKDGVTFTKFISSNIGDGGVNKDTHYNLKRNILSVLSRCLDELYRWLRGTEGIDALVKDDDFILSRTIKYQLPLIVKNNAYYDKMTLTGLYDHRVSEHSSEQSKVNAEHYSNKKNLINRKNNRVDRLDQLFRAYYTNKLSKGYVEEIINDKIKGYFNHDLDRDNPFSKRHKEQKNPVIYYRMYNQGQFWSDMGIYSTQGDYQEVLKFIKDTNISDNLESFINSFELMKRELVLEETNSLINQYDKVIRRLKDYGHKTYHTEKDTQQIHLSFE